jgi:hypothetical protein
MAVFSPILAIDKSTLTASSLVIGGDWLRAVVGVKVQTAKATVKKMESLIQFTSLKIA